MAGLALAVRFALDPWLGSHSPYVTFMVAVSVTVWLAGFGPALLTAALSVAAGIIFVVESETDPLAKVIGVSVFAVGMGIIAFLGRAMRGAQAKAEQAALEAQRHQAELALAKQQWEQTFDTVPDLIAIIDPQHRILRANRAMAERLGISAEQTVGLKCYGCVHGAERPIEGCPHAQSVADGLEHSAEVLEERLGGCFLVSCTPMRDAAGDLIGTVHVARDITESKRAEERLRLAADELARSNQDLEQFAYVASHDLQEPLRMVQGHMGIVAKRLKDKLDDSTRESMGYAIDGAARMQTLIRDLLAYSRVGRQNDDFVQTDTRAVVDQVLHDLKASVDEAQAAVRCEDLPALTADKAMISQLFQNLLSNAVKYRAAGRKPEISIAATRDHDAWIFSVRDNGIGMRPEDGERVFMIFQRLHTRQEYPGTGIGLAICKRIVEHHGGRIWVEAQPDKGATFHFTIPDR